MLMDSCAVMRGSKTGLEIRMHQYCPNLLDVDGDSCHHIHNAAKKFSEPFDSYLEKLFIDLQVDHQWSPDQVMYLKEIAMIQNLPASSPQRGFVPHRWLSAYDASMATHAMMPAYRVLYYGYLSTADKELYREPLELMYTISMTPQGRERENRVCQKLWHEETTTVLRLSICMGLLAILKEHVMVFQLSPSALREMALEDHMLLPSKVVFVGQEADMFRSQNPNHATVKYTLQSRGKTAVQHYATRCKNNKSEAATYKPQQKMNQKEKQQQQSKYGSGQQVKKLTAEEEERARLRHVAKQ
ncbi:unnamed protein product [Arctogadus glacialis]